MTNRFLTNLRARLARGIDLFNREYFFEAHDELEELWLDARTPVERNLFHGLVNIATGFYHYRMHNLKGMQSQLHKGMQKLAQVPDRCCGVEVAALLRSVQPYHASPPTLASLPEPLPQITFHPEELGD
ncbi:MAG: DUF309 domain-containing protein [candidate division KSB1 bacterium]|nr:DUF309 domain-containing protein [candidate division KSB1 bacterium]MDZ7275329.1 DUF309 domain-containing protein [candidate division KSB1 bacterium]MDZ7287496.1 DUF309 domain-containing protein [candidate division KSB1 bacterium]MDZ7299610.1 DUF309 domain-containing protein [candidate division KSB1 bacterium]MDZ7307403.1 DUF309 domain-containing protein [candidate division KSB1 bacterium]